ncbi:periplasmic protein involved in polysaccharide export [Terriglobus roseus DSM 18391]|uniref:Periplasmic protein involved in polysaccharide export n=2 Tax=Terriglobus roseus TaxID=392734 RepID=I3ZFK5_TERRK|nr:periplasmic protein involved in polysaccharide export [Terriglobus roseus DSM 18391]
MQIIRKSKRVLNRMMLRQIALAIFAVGILMTSMAAQVALKQRSSYRLHAGDQLTVQFTYTPDLNQAVTVQPDGYIVLPSTGQVQVGGRTVDEAIKLIEEKAAGHLKDPEVAIVLTDFQKPYFIVAGQVNAPLRYDMREPTTALKAVMLAGGIKSTGKEKQVVVFHDMEGASPQVRVLNLKKMSDPKIFEHDMELSSGDIVFVPRTTMDRVADVAKVAATFGLYLNAATYIITR